MVIFSVCSNILGAGFVCRREKSLPFASLLFIGASKYVSVYKIKTPALRGWSVALLAAAACLASLWLRGYSYSNSYWYGYLGGSA